MSRPIYESTNNVSYTHSSSSIAQKPGFSSLDQHTIPHFKQERPGYSQDQYPSDATAVAASKSIYQRGWDTTLKSLKKIRMRRVRLLYTVVCIILLLIWFIVMGVFAQAEKAGQQRNGRVGAQNRFKPFPGELVLQGTLRQFDAARHTLSVSWAAQLIDDNDNTVSLGAPNATGYEVGIYRDQTTVLLRDRNITLINPDTNQNETYFLTSVDNATAPVIGVVGPHEWDSFTTDIDFDRSDNDNWYQQLSGYPFETWSGQIVFLANDRDTAKSLNTTGSVVIEIYGASLRGSILNWRIEMDAVDTCESLDTPSCELHITITARRPSLVKFAAIVALLVNWSSTIFILVMSCEMTILGRDSVIEASDLLAVCFTALFALPTVRSILPGVGEFGAMNLLGIIPNVIIIAICTSMVSIVALKKKDQKTKSEKQV